MKVQLESIDRDSKSPFRLLHNPNLSALFYWHFHPEYELVYIEGANATRHVGNHISNFEHSDLVFIGSNIPHLNFDYGVKTVYKKDVLHIKPSFKNNVLQETPAFLKISQLFEKSQYGLAFFGETKKLIGIRLMQLHTLEPFERYIEILAILKILAESDQYVLLHEQPFINTYNTKEQQRIRQLYAFIDENYTRKINLDEVAALCNLSKPAFCRYFKKNTGNTFTGFLNEYRVSQAKRLLLIGMNVSETCYACGFDSLSYFNRTFKSITDENPSAFKRKHKRAF